MVARGSGSHMPPLASHRRAAALATHHCVRCGARFDGRAVGADDDMAGGDLACEKALMCYEQPGEGHNGGEEHREQEKAEKPEPPAPPGDADHKAHNQVDDDQHARKSVDRLWGAGTPAASTHHPPLALLPPICAMETTIGILSVNHATVSISGWPRGRRVPLGKH